LHVPWAQNDQGEYNDEKQFGWPDTEDLHSARLGGGVTRRRFERRARLQESLGDLLAVVCQAA
jgi:hypothetical protein